MRANCVYDDHLYFASSDARTVVAEGDPEPYAKMAVICKSNEDDTQWDLVADYRDFGDIPFDHIQTSWAGAPFWELASHKGYIYATAPSTAGFVIFKGRPAQEGESANDYGWHWEEVAGPNNGINNPGLSDVPGGEPGTMRSLIGSVYEFNGELYAYNFDHAFAGVAQSLVGMLQQLKSGEVKASDYLGYMYNTLHNPQKVWKLNDETGKFEELKAFTKLMEGTTNEYIWRMGDHNGKLYVATMDAGIGYGYMTQLTNGSFFKMSAAERIDKIGYLGSVIKLLALAKGNEKADELRTKLEQLKELLSQYVESEQIDEETLELIVDIDGLSREIRSLVANYLQDKGSQHKAALAALIVKAVEAAQSAKTSAKEKLQVIAALLAAVDYDTIKEQLKQFIELWKNNPEDARAILTEEVKIALAVLMAKVQADAADVHERIDLEGIKMYAYINRTVRTNEWGFDLLRTSDGGETFEVITRTGFDDKYNYGCPSFLSTEEGLYFGTCNPFCGGQLYLLSEGKRADSPTGIDEVKEEQPKTDGASNVYYDLSGRKVSDFNSLPKGIYIQNGNKVVSK